MAFDEMAERFHKIISKIEGILLTLVAKTQRRSKPAHHQLAGHQSAQNRIAIVEPCIEAIICALLAAREILPKEMLPVVDKPIIQYVVEEAVESGIEDIIIVTGANKRAIEDHFDRASELEDWLKENHKEKELEEKGWNALAEESLKEVWDNEKDEKVWRKYL